MAQTNGSPKALCWRMGRKVPGADIGTQQPDVLRRRAWIPRHYQSISLSATVEVRENTLKISAHRRLWDHPLVR
jgi:hypothetical protein